MPGKNFNHINYTCIGHCCHDVTKNGYALGGTASYSASVARSLGAYTQIITSFGPDFLFEDILLGQGLDLVNLGSKKTTVFENIYGQGARQQVIHSWAGKMKSNRIANQLTQPNIVHLSPIANEIDYHIVKQLNCELTGATIQGSLRCWDHSGKVYPCGMKYSTLEGIDVVIISDEDVIGVNKAIDQIIEVVPTVVMTQGKQGAKIYSGNSSIFMPSYSICQKRETGAGDTFAAAFFIQYHLTGDPVQSCIYAHAVSSLVLERDASEAFPSQSEILKRVGQYQKK